MHSGGKSQVQASNSSPVTHKPATKPAKVVCRPETTVGEVFGKSTEDFRFTGIDSAWTMQKDDPDAELDLIIGLDFGTTFTKVVITEPGSKRSWAVPLSTNPRNPYLINSEVYLDDGVYTLDRVGTRCTGLKLPFLSNRVKRDDSLHAVAFVASIIHFSKQWMLNANSKYLAGQKPFWLVNVGLPAKDFEKKQLVDQYIGLVWAAMFLTLDPASPISAVRAKDAFDQAAHANREKREEISTTDGLSVHRDAVNAFPEIMAQLYGFLRSKHWDVSKPEFMLVDVGGGTLDSSVFNVVKDPYSGELRFSVFTSRVDPLGTLVLHKERVNWILGELHGYDSSQEVQQVLRMTRDDFWLVPDNVKQYLKNAEFNDSTVDDDFLRKLKTAIITEQLLYVLKKVNPNFWRSKRPYPFVLVGGGSANQVYQQLRESRLGYKGVGIEPLSLPVPDNLTPKLTPDTYHRVSVAYGLAFENLGKIITPDKIKELEIEETNDQDTGWDTRFIGAEQV